MKINEVGSRSLTIFDIDDTLLHTTAQIRVVKDGRVVRTLNNQEFNVYQLKPGEQFDFGEFRDAEKFRRESEPIRPMIAKLKAILKSASNNKVIMLTARADLDDKHKVLDTFAQYGIDMSRVHIYRAGNLPGDAIPAEKKAVFVRKFLASGQYNRVRLYDDSMSNLRVFKELKQEYPTVDFEAYYVGPSGRAVTIESRDRSVSKLDKILVRLCAMVIDGQRRDPDHYGMVAAAVIDPEGRMVAAVNHWRGNKRVHGERAAMERYQKKYGKIPQGSMIVTTCSPCTEPMPDREGESCQDLINASGVTRVYAGYKDPSQKTDSEQHRYQLAFTDNPQLERLCEKFAETWLRDQLNELSFLGSECTKDCSGHRAGYYWSARKGNAQAASWSPSFNKGAALRAAGL